MKHTFCFLRYCQIIIIIFFCGGFMDLPPGSQLWDYNCCWSSSVIDTISLSVYSRSEVCTCMWVRKRERGNMCVLGVDLWIYFFNNISLMISDVEHTFVLIENFRDRNVSNLY